MNKYLRFLDKNIVYINLIISSSGLLFQINVLNPWHSKIDKKIDTIINRDYVK
jgi:hypothetical protein